MDLIEAEDAVVWINDDTKEVRVLPQGRFPPDRSEWHDPIGAAYSEWIDGSDEFRVRLMLETAIDLAIMGYPPWRVLSEFAAVRQFRALGETSYPMCRALTKALVGRSLEFGEMSFEELVSNAARGRPTGG